MSLQIKLIAFLLAIIALGAGALGIYHAGYTKGVTVTDLKWTAATEKLKADAAQALATETAKTRAIEQQLDQARTAQELKDAEHEKTVADLSDRLRAAAGPAGRLRDPNATGCWPGGGGAAAQAAGSAGAGAADAAEAGGLLSAELTGLLQRLTREADAINDAYASCRADAMTVRATSPP